MLAPPPFPFWPLSPSGPRLLLGRDFDQKELASIEIFKEALIERGLNYTSLRVNDPASLLLELNNAGAHRLVRKIVSDWGTVYSLWKVSDAYMEASGIRRREFRHLLKYLIFWGSDHPDRGWWPLRLSAGLSLFRREKEGDGVRQRLARAESLVVRLASALGKLTSELRIYSEGTKSPYRNILPDFVGQCEGALREAAYFGADPRPSKRVHADSELQLDEAQCAEKLIVTLVHNMERAIDFIDDAIDRIGPLDAHRARHVVRESATLLLEVLSDTEQEPAHTRAAVMLFDICLYASRILVGFWLIPLVLAARRLLRPKPALEAGAES
ncbi:MAG TPA: hypothetical protein VHY09_04520 [Candidatus Methylacidiphilales bacterium]|jgi:hypothetical protein|nr:hypothetical protein [Candidatus Methylacidiphilales bacterium]